MEKPAPARQSYFKVSCASATGKSWLLSYAVDSGYLSFVRILVAAGSRMPLDEIRDRQSGSGLSFFDNDELLKPIIDASIHPPSLQHFCRETVRKAVFARCRSPNNPHSINGVSPCRIDDLVASLPIPTRYRHYLLFDELEDIPVQKAQLTCTSNISMFQMSEISQPPCVFTAAMNGQQIPIFRVFIIRYCTRAIMLSAYLFG
jgi:SOCS box